VEAVGDYLELDGRPAVRLVRTFDDPVGRVWSAITDPTERDRWFPSPVTIDLREGGAVRFPVDPRPGPGPDPGRVLRLQPPHHLAFSWGADELRFDLAAHGPSCLLTFTDLLEEQNTAARNAAGWSLCLGALERLLAGEDTEGPFSTANAARFPALYEAHIAAGVPFGADLSD